MIDYSSVIDDCFSVRKSLLKLAFSSSGGQHLGGGLSMVEIMCTLYSSFLNISPHTVKQLNRDRFILSKGHGVLGFYPVLHHYGFLPDSVYFSYKSPGSQLISHPIKNLDYGIESSNGSLGHGLSYGAGIAYGLIKLNCNSKVYVLLGDGECNEGSVWEAAMSSSQLRLSNLVCIVDNNKLQSDGPTSEIISDDKLSSRWSSFGWHVISLNGHCVQALSSAFSFVSDSPTLILASTVKGKGVPFMEGDNSWHHGRLTEKTYEEAISTLYKVFK